MAAATSRYAGKRPAGRKAARPRRPARPGADSRGGSPAVLALQRRRTAQLVAAGTIFVALVAWKLLFPESLAAVAGTIREALGQDADFRAAFSAVGEAIAGEKSVEESLEEAYTAVFAPGRYAAEQTAAVLAAAEGGDRPGGPAAGAAGKPSRFRGNGRRRTGRRWSARSPPPPSPWCSLTAPARPT